MPAPAFLVGFESYTITTSVILVDKTLVTVPASRLRHGTTPALSAHPVLSVAITACAAILAIL